MNRLFWLLGLALALTLVLGMSIACDADDDDDDDDDDDCENNEDPTLLGFEIQYDEDGDGEYDNTVEAPYEWDEGEYARFFIGFEYEDEDCNLAGGEIWYQLEIDDEVVREWDTGEESLPEPWLLIRRFRTAVRRGV